MSTNAERQRQIARALHHVLRKLESYARLCGARACRPPIVTRDMRIAAPRECGFDFDSWLTAAVENDGSVPQLIMIDYTPAKNGRYSVYEFMGGMAVEPDGYRWTRDTIVDKCTAVFERSTIKARGSPAALRGYDMLVADVLCCVK